MALIKEDRHCSHLLAYFAIICLIVNNGVEVTHKSFCCCFNVVMLGFPLYSQQPGTEVPFRIEVKIGQRAVCPVPVVFRENIHEGMKCKCYVGPFSGQNVTSGCSNKTCDSCLDIYLDMLIYKMFY